MMFREKSISKYYAFALAAVFSLTLAGCGGSGGGGAMMDMDEEMPPVVVDPVDPVDPEPTPEEIAAEEAGRSSEADALTAAQEAAMTALYGGDGRRGHGAVDPAARGAARMRRRRRRDSQRPTRRRWLTTSAMAMEYQTAAETASAMRGGSRHDAQPGNHQDWRTQPPTRAPSTAQRSSVRLLPLRYPMREEWVAIKQARRQPRAADRGKTPPTGAEETTVQMGRVSATGNEL